MATCKRCQSEINFIRTEKGLWMPVEPKSITVITSLGKTIKAFVPHWGNCVSPDDRAADSHWNEEADRVYQSEHPEICGR